MKSTTDCIVVSIVGNFIFFVALMFVSLTDDSGSGLTIYFGPTIYYVLGGCYLVYSILFSYFFIRKNQGSKMLISLVDFSPLLPVIIYLLMKLQIKLSL